jgi:hypothetical protein
MVTISMKAIELGILQLHFIGNSSKHFGVQSVLKADQIADVLVPEWIRRLEGTGQDGRSQQAGRREQRASG